MEIMNNGESWQCIRWILPIRELLLLLKAAPKSNSEVANFMVQFWYACVFDEIFGTMRQELARCEVESFKRIGTTVVENLPNLRKT